MMNAKARRKNISAIFMYTASAFSLVSVATRDNWLRLAAALLMGLAGGVFLREGATAAGRAVDERLPNKPLQPTSGGTQQE